MTAGWTLGALPALCVAAAALELDNVHVGQTMVSRPLLAGPLIGWLAGAPMEGLSLGVLVELMTLDELPVGDFVPLNGTFAVAAAVLLAASPSRVAEAAALPVGLAAGKAFSRVELAVRSWRSRLAGLAERAAARGEGTPLAGLVAAGLASHAAAAALFLYAVVALAEPASAWAWSAAPEAGRRGLQLGYEAGLWLGWAGAVAVFLRR